MNPNDFKRLTPGRILRAGVDDMHGRGWKVRPLVILTKPETNSPEAEFRVACGSRTAPEPGNEYFAVEVIGIPNGHPRTGLVATTWFYAYWLRTLKINEIATVLKFFPEHDFLRFVEIIRSAGGV